MQQLNFSLDNIAAGQGLPIALTGMSIVFIALFLLCGFIVLLPRLVRLLEPYFPTEQEPAEQEHATPAPDPATVAAIAAAVHARGQGS